MDEGKLVQFVRHIVETSPDSASAALALNQLSEILDRAGELTPKTNAVIQIASNGTDDDFKVMKIQLQTASNARHVMEAAAKARDAKEEMSRLHGRC